MEFNATYQPFKSKGKQAIDLSLDRLKTVAAQMGIIRPTCPIITIGGTNGKGSTVHALQHIYQTNGYRVGVFTSPYISSPTELIHINGESITDTELLNLLNQIDVARDNTPLTEYEFLFLATLLFFKTQQPDIILLEVCMGGRDDVTNLINTDCAIITNIALDHCAWLGDTREAIGAIKAGILRDGIPFILGDDDPPKSVIKAAKDHQVECYQIGHAFHCLPDCFSIYPENATVACQAAQAMSKQLPLSINPETALISLNSLRGRCEIMSMQPLEIHDVTHNPAGAKRLADFLKPHINKPVHAVFSMFKDKDINGTIKPLFEMIDHWHIAPLTHRRGASTDQLTTTLPDHDTSCYHSIKMAYQAAKAYQPELLLVFGSFQVLAEIDNDTPPE